MLASPQPPFEASASGALTGAPFPSFLCLSPVAAVATGVAFPSPAFLAAVVTVFAAAAALPAPASAAAVGAATVAAAAAGLGWHEEDG